MVHGSAGFASFDELIDPVGWAAFERDYWEQRPLHLQRGGENVFAGLFSPADFDELITYNIDRNVPSFGHAKHSGIQPDPSAPNGKAFERLQAGETLFLPSLHRRSLKFAALCRTLEDRFRHPVGCTMVITPPNAQGLSPHFDADGVFAMQMVGRKTWQVGDASAHRFPMFGDESTMFYLPEIPAPRTDYAVEPGDLLYVPGGFPHLAFTSDVLSVHVSIYINTIRWKDVLMRLVGEAARADAAFRGSIPLGALGRDGGADVLRAGLEPLLARLAENADAERVYDGMTRGLLDTMPQLPSRRLAEFGVSETIDPSTPVEHAPGVICHVVSAGATARILFPGNFVEGPAHIEPALRFIADHCSFTPSDVPGLGPESRLVIVRRLLREGMLQMATKDRVAATRTAWPSPSK
jgi:ribosomal protein L16 Arg81 hydroxylase